MRLGNIIIKFPYNARFDWLKQHTLPENNVQVKDIDIAAGPLTEDLRRIAAWCCANGLLINPDKTKLLLLENETHSTRYHGHTAEHVLA